MLHQFYRSCFGLFVYGHVRTEEYPPQTAVRASTVNVNVTARSAPMSHEYVIRSLAISGALFHRSRVLSVSDYDGLLCVKESV